jgi:acetate kinase
VRVVVVNAGSVTLKLSVVAEGGEAPLASRTVDHWDGEVDPIRDFVAGAGAVDAVGHRVVHGGERHHAAVVLDDGVIADLRALAPLAPLHQARGLIGVDAVQRVLPSVPHVACFDTAFHAAMPAAAYTYALPADWRARGPLRRFGFHGLSHAYAARRAARIAGRPVDELRIVSCHLGAGASLCAVDRGRSVDTTMGFTPLEGLVMATRAGSIDPGIVPWLVRRGGLSLDEIADGLEHRSGLVGLAGTADMRVVLARRRTADAEATLAFDVYVHALRRALGAMAAVLSTVDAFVFTGGVGEHAPEVRAACGLPLDAAANAAAQGDADIGAAGADVRTFVVTAREDLEIARQVRHVAGR